MSKPIDVLLLTLQKILKHYQLVGWRNEKLTTHIREDISNFSRKYCENMDPDVVDYLEISMHVGDHILCFGEKGNHDDPTEVSATNNETDTGSDELFIDFSKIYRGNPEHSLETISQSKSNEKDSFSVDNSASSQISVTKDPTDFERANLLIDFSKATHGVSIDLQKTVKNKSDESDSFISHSESESKDDEDMELHKIKRKKGVRNEHKWRRNVRQNNRLLGKKYVPTKNVAIEEKSIKPPCPDKCRLKCNQRFTEEQRLKIYSKYWHLKSWDLKKEFVCSCIQTFPVGTHRFWYKLDCCWNF
ncbi:hypothetical protein JTE90_015211 [Oedothorax gibbosus]|uniref:Uncharacterized protein n=1 Tax=Oedothorax gibbosus TaxID=931172 RepID=A0AAV6V7X6_9ARAC|nr:hypothetical protein JTE90_015211 [Oedothorax gibbosus]